MTGKYDDAVHKLDAAGALAAYDVEAPPKDLYPKLPETKPEAGIYILAKATEALWVAAKHNGLSDLCAEHQPAYEWAQTLLATS